MLKIITSENELGLYINNETECVNNLAYNGNDSDPPMDFETEQHSLTYVTRRFVNCAYKMLLLSMFILCKYYTIIYFIITVHITDHCIIMFHLYHHENRHTKHKWFCG